MTAEFKRLGKRGSYRLGQLRAQGVSVQRHPAPFRPRFVRRSHRWPAWVWLLGLAAGAAIIVGAAAAGWWFMPFAAGLLAGLANRAGSWPVRIALPAVAVVAALGWAAPLCWSAWRGRPEGAMARVVAGQLGLPRDAAVGVLLTLGVAVAQAVVGYWLGRALTPRPAGR